MHAHKCVKLGTAQVRQISKCCASQNIDFSEYSQFLGNTTTQNCLARLLPLWKNSFPRSVKEAESEKNRGDAFTWTCTLEARIGALASMAIFAKRCTALMNDEIARKMVHAVECSLMTVSQ